MSWIPEMRQRISFSFAVLITGCYYSSTWYLFSTIELNVPQKQLRKLLLQLSVSSLISLSKIFHLKTRCLAFA